MPTLYEITVPVFTRGLRGLDHLLVKAAESGIDERSLLTARLAIDMLPLARQVQMACDTAKLAVMRIAQTKPMPMIDDESTLMQLRARIARTIVYLEQADPAAFDGREAATIMLRTPLVERAYTGEGFVTGFSLPNFFFHVTTTYALLRLMGVRLGKLDYFAGDHW